MHTSRIRYSSFLAALFASLASGPFMLAQTNDTTTPAAAIAEPQYSSITSTNNVVQLSRLPIVYNGKTYYEDVTLTLDYTVDTAVNPATLAVKVTPAEVTSPVLTVNGFKAGTYVGPSDVNGGKSIIVVSGPAPLSGGGSEWTLTTNSSSSTYTYPSTAVWYDEPIAGNPLATRIKNAKITSTAYAFGEGDSGGDPGNNWYTNTLMGFTQVGNTLSISSFTNGDTDSATPTDTITYTLE